jgi:ABC-type phosphate transport system auxiliary subunit
MKTIEIESIAKMSSLDLSYVIFFWKDYDPNSVIIAYNELVKRKYPISGNFYDKMTEFRKKNFLSENE